MEVSLERRATAPTTASLWKDESLNKQDRLLVLKKGLKSWEKTYETKHGRKPTKEDISESPLEIREMYMKYHDMKKSSSSSVDDNVKKSSASSIDDNVFAPSLNKGYKRSLSTCKDTPCMKAKSRKWIGESNITTPTNEPIQRVSVKPNNDIKYSTEPLISSEQCITLKDVSLLPVSTNQVHVVTPSFKTVAALGSRNGVSETWLDNVKRSMERSPVKNMPSAAVEATTTVRSANGSCFLWLEDNLLDPDYPCKTEDTLCETEYQDAAISTNEEVFSVNNNFDHPSSSSGADDKSDAKQKEDDNCTYRKGASVSENFVSLNLKAKKFSRKSQTIGGSRYKRQQWKKRQQLNDGDKKGKKTVCFKCGEPGHWARSCTKLKLTSSKVLGTFDGEAVTYSDDTSGMYEEGPTPLISDCDKQKSTQAESLGLEASLVQTNRKPFEPTNFNVDPDEVLKYLAAFGYSDFKAGQKDAITQVLSGHSTLLVQPTGAGKSLCYQLPAYIYTQHSHCFVLIISPLISLMDDQIKNLPSGLSGACIHNGLSYKRKQQIIVDLEAGFINVLLITPETLISGSSNDQLFSNHLPPIAFACIDEIHCLSEWSHNFRPAYLRLPKVLKKQLGVHCILGLTATANQSTVHHISELLDIKPEHVILGSSIPDNLSITVSCETNRLQALVDLLKTTTFSCCNSIIIYCTRQQTTERVAQVIRTSVGSHSEEATSRSGRKQRWIAECYHAGLSMEARKRIQSNFMSGKLRIIVATVAFGMGLNKPDVRAVIHYNMPKSFESFVQEIGRAGRDGEPSYCHVFVDNDESDLLELRRHVHANGVDYFFIKKLCQEIFSKSEKDYEVALPIDDLTMSLDANEETLSTLLCYLENDGWIEVLNPVCDSVTIKCYGERNCLDNLAARLPVIASALKNKISYNANQLSFSLTKVAHDLKCSFHEVHQVLHNLEDSTDPTNNIIMESNNLSFHVRLMRNVSSEERDSICMRLLSKIRKKEKNDLDKLHEFSSVLKHVSQNGPDLYFNLREIITVYFSTGFSSEYLQSLGIITSIQKNSDGVSKECHERNSDLLVSDIRSLLNMHEDSQFTGRAIARILQGIGSPCYPAKVWATCPLWRKHIDSEFHYICDIATQQILRRRL